MVLLGLGIVDSLPPIGNCSVWGLSPSLALVSAPFFLSRLCSSPCLKRRIEGKGKEVERENENVVKEHKVWFANRIIMQKVIESTWHAQLGK